MDIINSKYESLKTLLGKCGRVVIAFSGGVDSAFLLKVATDVLGENVIAVTADSIIHSPNEIDGAKSIAEQFGVEHIIIKSKEMDNPVFTSNPVNRCYVCKNAIFNEMKKTAKSLGCEFVIEGSNADDINDYRPGMKALKELNILSPLKEAGLAKNEIRKLSKEMSLSTWDKPSLACLASRIPYGEKITKEKLNRIYLAETYLHEKRFTQLRVRDHGAMARIELDVKEQCSIMDDELKSKIIKKFKQLGYNYITLDLEGYRTGSLNINLK